METPKHLVRLFVFISFAAIFVRGKHGVRRNLSQETGLTPSCVKRVLATCATSQSFPLHVPSGRNYDAEEINVFLRALDELSTGQRDLHHFLKEWLGSSKVQEKSLLDMKSDVHTLRKAASQSLRACESSKTHEESSLLKEVKEQRLLLEGVAKTSNALQDSIVSEIQKSLTKMQRNMTEQRDSLLEIHKDLQSMKKSQEQITKQGRALSEIKEILEKKNQSRPLSPQSKTPPNQEYTPKNCADLLKLGDKVSGVRTVYPFLCDRNRSLSVLCDQTSDGGGWTVFQVRDALPQREDFFRTWAEYQDGFGDLTKEFWLGLDNIHAFVRGTLMELRVDLEDFEGTKKWAKYEDFYIDDVAGKYKLHLKGYSGDAGDSLMARHSGMMFSTKDQDNDNWGKHCAQVRRGGWWYDDCTSSNLNGFPFQGKYTNSKNSNYSYDGIEWVLFRGNLYSLKKTSMKMRPKVRK